MKDPVGPGHLHLVPSGDLGLDITESESGLRVPTPSLEGIGDDRDLIRRIGRVELINLDKAVWRHLSPYEQKHPGSGEAARGTGGRFNPPGSFPVVYGTLRRATAGAEFWLLARRNPIDPSWLLPRHIYRFRFSSDKVLDLRSSSVREAIGLSGIALEDVPAMQTQLIGEIAYGLGIEAIVAASSSGHGDMVAIFTDLIPRSCWEIRHVELWQRIDDIPRSPQPPLASSKPFRSYGSTLRLTEMSG
jgi:RES domain-containing protein